MIANPKLGEINSDCLIYGTKNLYILGSNVFLMLGLQIQSILMVLALRLSKLLINNHK